MAGGVVGGVLGVCDSWWVGSVRCGGVVGGE